MRGKLVVTINNGFDIQYYGLEGGLFAKATYGNNVLDPASGYYNFGAYDGSEHCFVEYYGETDERRLERLHQEFPDWEIEVR